MFNAKEGQYAPDQIPSGVNVKLYTHYNISGSKYSIGKLEHWDCDMSGEQRVLLCTTPVYVQIPPVEDLKKKAIEALEAEKKKCMAEHHKKMTELQGKIDGLLCLEYTPQSENVVEVEF